MRWTRSVCHAKAREAQPQQLGGRRQYLCSENAYWRGSRARSDWTEYLRASFCCGSKASKAAAPVGNGGKVDWRVGGFGVRLAAPHGATRCKHAPHTTHQRTSGWRESESTKARWICSSIVPNRHTSKALATGGCPGGYGIRRSVPDVAAPYSC